MGIALQGYSPKVSDSASVDRLKGRKERLTIALEKANKKGNKHKAEAIKKELGEIKSIVDGI